MARMPGAEWSPLASNWASQPRMRGHNFVCIHTMVGSLEGTDSYFRWGNGAGYDGTESHYGTGYNGRIEQWQDTAFQAEANLNGNGDVISIENADVGTGFPAWNLNDGSQVPAFTAAQVEAIAHIVAWECSPAAHAGCPTTWPCHNDGIPLDLVPDTKPGRRGVAYHRQGIDPWRVYGGTLWSSHNGKVCPGDRRIAQIPQIIARAREIMNGDDMPLSDADVQKVADKVLRTRLKLKDGSTPQVGSILVGIIDRLKSQATTLGEHGIQLDDIEDYVDGDAPAEPPAS